MKKIFRLLLLIFFAAAFGIAGQTPTAELPADNLATLLNSPKTMALIRASDWYRMWSFFDESFNIDHMEVGKSKNIYTELKRNVNIYDHLKVYEDGEDITAQLLKDSCDWNEPRTICVVRYIPVDGVDMTGYIYDTKNNTAFQLYFVGTCYYRMEVIWLDQGTMLFLETSEDGDYNTIGPSAYMIRWGERPIMSGIDIISRKSGGKIGIARYSVKKSSLKFQQYMFESGLSDSKTHTLKVEWVEKNDVLYIRSAPSPRSEKVGKIPYNGRGILYMKKAELCQGRLWVKVSYRGQEGWINSKFLAPD